MMMIRLRDCMTQIEWPSSSASSFVAVPYLGCTATLTKQALSGVLGLGYVFREALALGQVRGVELCAG